MSLKQTIRQTIASGEQTGESPLLPTAAVITAALLYATLPAKFISGSSGLVTFARVLVPLLSIGLIIPLALTTRRRLVHSVTRRTAALIVIALLSTANTISIVLLVHLIVVGHKVNGHELIRAAIHIWCTNVIVFALWFWELDGGGPLSRRLERAQYPDFLFPQTDQPAYAPPDWQPLFLDYLYVSFTNAMAFSPTDTMPLTRWAKFLMLVQSAASLLLLAMVAARAVNILQ
jgi:uncharacterized membrane protein